MNPQTAVIHRVASKDGAAIAFEQAGSGPALILVHGTGGDRGRWAMVQALLAPHSTLCLLDRRGRGLSGDGPDYSIEREYEDLAAVAAGLDGPVDILGHSFGAAVALGAARRIPNLRRLILYEPPALDSEGNVQRNQIIARMEQALAAGNPEEATQIMMREMLGVPQAMIDRARSTPAWAGSVAAAATFPRELRCSSVYAADREGLKTLPIPVRFFLGSASPAGFKLTTETLSALLPNSSVVLLPDQQHSAMLTAPALFAEEVLRFLQA